MDIGVIVGNNASDERGISGDSTKLRNVSGKCAAMRHAIVHCSAAAIPVLRKRVDVVAYEPAATQGGTVGRSPVARRISIERAVGDIRQVVDGTAATFVPAAGEIIHAVALKKASFDGSRTAVLSCGGADRRAVAFRKVPAKAAVAYCLASRCRSSDVVHRAIIHIVRPIVIEVAVFQQMRLADCRAAAGLCAIPDQPASDQPVDIVCRASSSSGDIVREHAVKASAAPLLVALVDVVVVAYRAAVLSGVADKHAIRHH